MNKTILAMTSVFGLITAGCAGQSLPGYDTICVDPITQVRLPDVNCVPLDVYYVPFGTYVPAYGVHITHYNVQYTRRPAHATIHTGGISSTGGKASKPAPKVSLKKGSSNTGKTTIRSRVSTRIRSTFRSGR